MRSFIAILMVMATLCMTTACSTYHYREVVTGPDGRVYTVERTQTNDETGKYLGQAAALAIPVAIGAWAWRHW